MKNIGKIQPIQESVKTFNAKSFESLVKKLNLAKTTPYQREKIYRKHLMEKYGQGLS